MDLAKRATYLLAIMAVFRLSASSVYKVGDSVGWTTAAVGNIDYSNWAAARTFYVQDIIIFEYNAQNHNVMQVSLADFHSCNGSAPMATYSTGNDSITIKNPGHYYYLCGFPGHCQAGQKVDIRVLRNAQSTTNSTTLVPGNALIDFTPEDSTDGIMAPNSNNPMDAAHCVISSSWFLSNKLGLLLFLLGLHLFCIG